MRQNADYMACAYISQMGGDFTQIFSLVVMELILNQFLEGSVAALAVAEWREWHGILMGRGENVKKCKYWGFSGNFSYFCTQQNLSSYGV